MNELSDYCGCCLAHLNVCECPAREIRSELASAVAEKRRVLKGARAEIRIALRRLPSSPVIAKASLEDSLEWIEKELGG